MKSQRHCGRDSRTLCHFLPCHCDWNTQTEAPAASSLSMLGGSTGRRQKFRNHSSSSLLSYSLLGPAHGHFYACFFCLKSTSVFLALRDVALRLRRNMFKVSLNTFREGKSFQIVFPQLTFSSAKELVSRYLEY